MKERVMKECGMKEHGMKEHGLKEHSMKERGVGHDFSIFVQLEILPRFSESEGQKQSSHC